ncbi:MAG TPA: ATP-dependent DNA ligase, partial [Nitrospiria bacterium]|nr:ATP-dependent DNA ligase [Nitrospiria bacterium]
TKRLEMFDILAELFQKARPEEIDKIIYLTQGELLPPFHGLMIGMSEKYLLRVIARVVDRPQEEVVELFRKEGDLGKTAERLIEGKGKGHSVVQVYDRLFSIAKISGEGSVERKIETLSGILSDASPKEAKYIARFVVGRLRMGAGDATVLEALAKARGDRALRPDLERAYNITSDLGLVARTLFTEGEEGVRRIRVRMSYPIRPALCERLSSAEEIVEKIGRCSVEMKYDGFRCQVHKSRKNVAIFSRNLERTTPMFPEIVEAVNEYLAAPEAIIEGEALAYDEATGDLLPFQVTIQRKRKHGIEEAAKSFPLRFYVFDLLYLNGEDFTEKPYAERRSMLASLVKKNGTMVLSEAIETDDPKEIVKFFDSGIERGLEGVVAKRLDTPYSAGSRNFNWIKLKRSYKGELSDTIDICIVGYFAGKGHRAQFGIGGILGAVYDSDSDTFKTVSRVGSGFTEEEWGRLKKTLDDTKISHKPARVDSLIEPDVWVTPTYVVTVTADEITRSPSHTAGRDEQGIGYALRFPRAQGWIREDKRAEDAN